MAHSRTLSRQAFQVVPRPKAAHTRRNVQHVHAIVPLAADEPGCVCRRTIATQVQPQHVSLLLLTINDKTSQV